MTLDDSIERVIAELRRAGYRELKQPAVIGGISFEFQAMLVGDTSLDLVALVDTIVNEESDRVRDQVEGLTRALDLAKSRRPLTVIFVGQSPGLALVNAISRVCRVLVVGPSATASDKDLVDAIAVLLPLSLSSAHDDPLDSWVEVRESILTAHPDPDIEAIFGASEDGASAVSETLQRILSAPLLEDES